MEYRIALAQVAPRLGDVDANLEIAADRVRAAAAEGAALTLLPELALTGYLLQDLVPEVAMRAHPFLVIAPLVAEVWMLGYLLVKGVRSSGVAETAPIAA